MAADNEIHNDLSGTVGGHSIQIGVNYGTVSTSPAPPAWRFLDEEQVGMLRRLADKVAAASRRELARWGAVDRDALPVRWRNAAEDLIDYPEKIHGDTGPITLDGQFKGIQDTYEAVLSKRLVILGAAGSGKTVLAHRLITGLLSNGSSTGQTGPVPVPLNLGDWNPATTTLPRWLAQRLVRDFPSPDNQGPIISSKQADLLLERGTILPVLDGFDEIPAQHHPAAICQLSLLDLPLIVTSRPDEYAAATHRIKAVSGAAAIALEPLTLDEAHHYLRNTTGKTRCPAWKAVFEHLRTEPDEPVDTNLTAVLTSPLMVVLARIVYNDSAGSAPLELLDGQRFPTTASVEDHLLRVYFGTSYTEIGVDRPRRPNWSPDRARHWLGHLAAHLERRGTQDLAWWHLPTTLGDRPRIIFSAVVSGITSAITFACMFGVFGLMLGLGIGLTTGMALGIAFGIPAVIDEALGSPDRSDGINPWTYLARNRRLTLQHIERIMQLTALLCLLFPQSWLPLVFAGIQVASVRLLASGWGSWLLLTRLWLPLTGNSPWRPKRFLDDAHAVGVLRTVGAVYQFRHARLRDHLARHH